MNTPDVIAMLRHARSIGARAPETELRYQLNRDGQPAAKNRDTFWDLLSKAENAGLIRMQLVVEVTPAGADLAGVSYVTGHPLEEAK